MERVKPVKDGIYHIYNRGVENKNVFLDESDYFRFIHDLFEFNDELPVNNFTHFLNKEVGLHYIRERRPRKLLVEILTFCLMPNHFHLMVKQKSENGTPEFMRKLKTGYTNYFNQKYKRPGSLFQGKYKIVAIKEEAHFSYLPHYIHCNPLDLTMPDWRQRKIRNPREAMKFLEEYRWSSFLDYIGQKNFPSFTSREIILDYYGGQERYKKNLIEWFQEMNQETLKSLSILE